MVEQAPPSSEDRKTLMGQVRTMGWNFWACSLIEGFERLAFFGVSAIRSLYMKNTLDIKGGARGSILGIWALLQCIVPMISSGYTDAYGYRISMVIAFLINIMGYSLMANSSGFGSMFLAACLVGLGTAIFKPPIQTSVATSLDERNSELGVGIFYWVINIGGALAPMIASALRGNDLSSTWHYAFYAAAIFTAINFLPATFLFREPKILRAPHEKSPLQDFASMMLTLWNDRRLLSFLLVISGFWFMFMQLWDLLPIAVDEWVDTRDVGAIIGSLGGWWEATFLDSTGAAKAELLINIDAIVIILFVVPLSAMFSRVPTTMALFFGMVITTMGFMGAGVCNSGATVSLAIFVFAMGEMICSPKFTEFINVVAPPDKKALYMRYSNIPFALGWAGGNFVSQPLYGRLSGRDRFARRYLEEQLKVSAAEMKTLETAAHMLPIGAKPDGPLLDAIYDKLALAGNPLVYKGTESVGKRYAATAVLWNVYRPWKIWPVLGAVGLISLIGMLLFHRVRNKTGSRGYRGEEIL
ncbi:MAG: MFS transporter [Deltaproteobacteria bacterium]|nr:MFS transporter [Deltaproteobacteria bacterium]